MSIDSSLVKVGLHLWSCISFVSYCLKFDELNICLKSLFVRLSYHCNSLKFIRYDEVVIQARVNGSRNELPMRSHELLNLHASIFLQEIGLTWPVWRYCKVEEFVEVGLSVSRGTCLFPDRFEFLAGKVVPGKRFAYNRGLIWYYLRVFSS